MAFNIHEEYWDRPLSGNNQDNRIPHGIAVFPVSYTHLDVYKRQR